MCGRHAGGVQRVLGSLHVCARVCVLSCEVGVFVLGKGRDTTTVSLQEYLSVMQTEECSHYHAPLLCTRGMLGVNGLPHSYTLASGSEAAVNDGIY